MLAVVIAKSSLLLNQKNIVELLTIQTLVDAGQTVIVGRRWWHPSHSRREPTKRCKYSHRQRFFCSERLAEQVDADLLVILTAVEKSLY